MIPIIVDDFLSNTDLLKSCESMRILILNCTLKGELPYFLVCSKVQHVSADPSPSNVHLELFIVTSC
jgi:hypothetical protein